MLDQKRYLYTDDIELEGDDVIQILYLARKYILQDLVQKCTDYLQNNIRIDNVCAILKDSVQFGEKEVTKLC